MPLTAAGKNLALDALAAAITHLALSDGTEVTGGSYARQAVAFASASGGAVAMTGTEVFSVPAGEAADRVEFMSASSGGTNYGNATFPTETFGSDGTLTINTLTITLSDPA